VTRAFLAVCPPDAVLDEVEQLAAGVRDRVEHARWTRREQWHLTVQFLGNRTDVDGVTGALRGLEHPAGELRLGELGAFPSARRARVLWVGTAVGTEWLGALAAAVGERLAPVGYPPEARPFHGHLTLARLEPPTDVRALLDEVAVASVGPAWTVAEVVLFESRLRRTGAEYSPIGRFPLRVEPGPR
jgi:2'-5' RNA ligase